MLAYSRIPRQARHARKCGYSRIARYPRLWQYPVMSTPITDTAWIPSTATFGARLALVRWRMGWNVREAAQACDLKESNWRGWELDGRLPHRLNEVAGKIAATTGASKYWLIDGEGQPSDYKATLSQPAFEGIVTPLLQAGKKPNVRPRGRHDSTHPTNYPKHRNRRHRPPRAA